jgi:hypothetical protein
MTTRYSRGKVYKLIDATSDKFYVGSTCSTLAHRLGEHKSKAKKTPLPVHRFFNDIGWNNVRIILIESVAAQTKDQLRMREQHHMDLLKPELNRCAAYVNCPHGRQHSLCKECGGASICLHNRIKSTCKECGGASICSHKKRKTQCKDCGGVSICSHGKQKSRCKEYGGSQICSHGKQKSQCKDCNGDKHYCSECEQTFASLHFLTGHNKSQRHQSKSTETPSPRPC